MKLLLLTNAVFLSLLISTCHKKSKHQNNNNVSRVDKPAMDSMMTSQDSFYTKNQDKAKSTSSGMDLDSCSKNEKYETGKHHMEEAPKHSSPEKMKIDSIKKSKEKTKKN